MKLSIIIKIEYYNDKLKKCIENLVANNRDIETIIIIKNEKSLIDKVQKIIDQYSESNNIYILKSKTDNLNDALNLAIINSNGEYIHIINQNIIISNNLYYELELKLEEFKYDLLIFDYININKEIEYYKAKEIYEKYFSENINNYDYIEVLSENDLRIDFSKFKIKKKRSKDKNIKGLTLKSSNIKENIQVFDNRYKEEILYQLNLKEFNIIINKNILLKSKHYLHSNMKSSIDLYKNLPYIKSIGYLDSFVFNFLHKEQIDSLNSDTTVKETVGVKESYKKINELYNQDKNLYEYMELLEFNIFYEFTNSIKKKTCKKYSINENTKEVYSYLKSMYPDLKENKYYKRRDNKSKALRHSIKLIEKTIETDIKRLENKKRKEQKERLKPENKKVINKTKVKNINKNTNINNEKNKKKKRNKNKNNKFKALLRKARMDFNRIKRTRINDNLIKTISKAKNTIINFIKSKYILFKNIFKFKRKKDQKNEILLLENKEPLLLNSAETTEVESHNQTKANIDLNKTNKLEKQG